MPRLRIVPIDDTESIATILDILIRRRFGQHRSLEKKSTSLWFLDLDGYDWSTHDAEFMEALSHNLDLVAGWNYQDYR